jgi:hypothetical protein
MEHGQDRAEGIVKEATGGDDFAGKGETAGQVSPVIYPNRGVPVDLHLISCRCLASFILLVELAV